MTPVYIQPSPSCQVDHERVRIGDVADVFCPDPTLCARIKGLELMRIPAEDEKRYVVSAMALVAHIHQEAGQPVSISNIGAGELIVSRARPKAAAAAVAAKIAAVTLITFFGSIFAIMTYNEDVDVNGVFDRLYQMFTGTARSGPGILEAAYAVGVGLGVLLFFNHLGWRRRQKEPTPMEIEMEKFETDLDQTWIQEAARNGTLICRSRRLLSRESGRKGKKETGGCSARDTGGGQ